MRLDLNRASEDLDTRSLYRNVIAYAKNMGLILVDKFLPFYLSSIGAHVANMRNKRASRRGFTFYTVGRRIPDLRVHLFSVAPPGFSKTTFIDTFFEHPTGLAVNGIPDRPIGSITEAKLVGTYEKGEKIPGVAEAYPNHILHCEEFSGIEQSMSQEHSKTMDSALLKFLDHGHITKDVRGGDIDYQTYATMWTGTQTERLNLESGMGRRLLPMDMNPSDKDITAYRKARKAARGKEPDYDTIHELRMQFREFATDFMVTQPLVFTKDYDDIQYSMDLVHSEDIVFEKLAIGYNVMNNYTGEENITVDMDATLEVMFKQLYAWRKMIFGESGVTQVMLLIRDKEWALTKLKDRLGSLGISHRKSSKTIEKMIEDGIIKLQTKTVKGSKRPVSLIGKGKNWPEPSIEEVIL